MEMGFQGGAEGGDFFAAVATTPVQSFGADVSEQSVGAVRAGLRSKHDITVGYRVEQKSGQAVSGWETAGIVEKCRFFGSSDIKMQLNSRILKVESF